MISELEPWLQPYAQYILDVAELNGLQPVITSTYRSYESQARLYQNYLAGRSRFPAAPPGRSLHEYRRAWDMVVTPRSALHDLGALWTSMGGRWGGTADPIHFAA